MSTTLLPLAAQMTVTTFGEGQHLFEPMAARCTTTTIISSSSCTF